MNKHYNLDASIRRVPNFPKEGILFYDITSILLKPKAFAYCLWAAHKRYKKSKIDMIAAIESRGFIFAAPLAQKLGVPLLLVRKKGKLPGKTVSINYTLEYGNAEMEIHAADIPQGGRVLIVDDLIATGGSVKAAVDLLKSHGANPVGVFAVIGLPFLDYQKKLGNIPVHTLVEYFSE